MAARRLARRPSSASRSASAASSSGIWPSSASARSGAQDLDKVGAELRVHGSERRGGASTLDRCPAPRLHAPSAAARATPRVPPGRGDARPRRLDASCNGCPGPLVRRPPAQSIASRDARRANGRRPRRHRIARQPTSTATTRSTPSSQARSTSPTRASLRLAGVNDLHVEHIASQQQEPDSVGADHRERCAEHRAPRADLGEVLDRDGDGDAPRRPGRTSTTSQPRKGIVEPDGEVGDAADPAPAQIAHGRPRDVAESAGSGSRSVTRARRPIVDLAHARGTSASRCLAAQASDRPAGHGRCANPCRTRVSTDRVDGRPRMARVRARRIFERPRSFTQACRREERRH